MSESEPIDTSFRPESYQLTEGDDPTTIATIEIESTTYDITILYASLKAATICYQVVDEYGGSTLTEATERESTEPLTLAELDEFFLGAWPFLEVLERNFESDVDGMLGFFRGRSHFYPDFDKLLRQHVIETFSQSG